MFQIGKTIVSESIIDNEFICNLSACKGACCVRGEAGAPLTSDEAQWLSDNRSTIESFLPESGRDALQEQGAFLKNGSGEYETPLVQGRECAYTYFETDGSAHCGIERAHKEGEVTLLKPISCHLYPLRIQDYSEFSAVNYHHWSICSDACALGAHLKIPVYQFVKDALILKFGQDWYDELCRVAKTYSNQKFRQKRRLT